MAKRSPTATPLCLLQVLLRYSDESHPLSQQEMIDYLKEDYDISVERKTVSRAITTLRDFDYDIRTPDNGRGFYLLQRPFEDSEISMLIDSVLFATDIPPKQRRDLISRLERLASPSYHNPIDQVSSLPAYHPINKQLFYTRQVLNDAIRDKCKVSFHYCSFGVDKKLHRRREEPRVASPYQIVATNGRFYLICAYDGHDDYLHLRLDLILDIEALDEKARPIQEIHGLENGLDLPQHMVEHLYMFTGPAVKVSFRCPDSMAGAVLDWMGRQVTIMPEKETGWIRVTTSINPEAMLFWALQYGRHVEVLEPASLRETLADVTADMAARYAD